MQKYTVTGMSCAACSSRVEKAAKSVNGVDSCSVNLLTGSLSVEGTADAADVIRAVEKQGYGCREENEKAQNQRNDKMDTKPEKSNGNMLPMLISSIVILLLLMYLSMGQHMLGLPLPPFFTHNPAAVALAQLLCSIAVIVINGRFFVSGTKAVLRLAPNMDTLVALGSGASFVYSTAVLFGMCSQLSKGNLASAEAMLHDVYFDSAAMILVLVTVGKMLEARSKDKTGDAIRELKKLVPREAVVVRDGKELRIDISDIVVGDIFLVRPGEQIPVDGFVLEGRTAVNEAAITGESVPAEKGEGDTVIGASVNTSGFIKCRATRVGDDTVISKIIETVNDASASKAPIAKLADKVAAVFVPSVMTIALITAIVWLFLGEDIGFAIARAVAVLVISCPCALGLATPVAVMVGSGVGARHGILFKNAVILEACGRVDTVVLDKTGTVTSGDIKVVGVYTGNGVSRSELLSAAYTVEAKSEHPLSRAVTAYCEEIGVALCESSDFENGIGSGVTCICDGKRIVGGKSSYLESLGVSVPQSALSTADELSLKGITPLFFGSDEKYLGIIAVSDSIRADSKHAIGLMHKKGIKTVMLSGDNQLVTASVADRAGVDEFVSGASPSDKAQVITDLCKKGKVAMVGDGINDAPALASADVGIAIGSGTDIARNTAGIVILGNGMTGVYNAIKLSRAVLTNIKQNLFWAFLYNCIGIPVAAGVLVPLGITLSPKLGALAMGLSSFCVVSNALRLNTFKGEKPVIDTEATVEDGTEEVTETTEQIYTEETGMTKTYKVEGMMCNHCEAHVKKALEAHEGIASARPDYKSGVVEVEFCAEVAESEIAAIIKDEGYEFKGEA